MKWLLFLLSIPFIAAIELTAQVNPKVPDWVNKIEVKKDAFIDKNKAVNGYYYLLLDEQHNTVARQNYYHYAKAIVNEEALTNVSQIEFSYDPSYQRGVLHYVKVIRGLATIDKTRDLDYKILNEEGQRSAGLLTGTKTFYTNLSDIRKGDIIEYCFSLDGENPIMGNYFDYEFSLGFSDPVDKVYYRILFPKETKPTILNKNTSVQPAIRQTNLNDYVWEVINPAPLKQESSVPLGYDPYPTVQISNVNNWNEVKSHFRSMMVLPPYDHSELKLITDSVTKISPNPEVQISAIVDFVQKHIRYSGNENGIYSHVPRAPDYVLKNRYGDCKEKSVLLNELLRLIHIEAFPVLINTTLRVKTPEQVTAIHSFNHCISSFIVAGKLYFIDPTISYQAGSFKHRVLPNYGTGMILDNKPQAFTAIPVNLSSTTKIEDDFIISDSADTKLNVACTYTGTDADDMRYYFKSTSISEIQDYSKKYYNKYSDNILVLDTIKFTDDSSINEFKTTESYLLKKFWSVDDSSKTGKIKKDFLPYSLNYKLNYGEEMIRKDPLQIEYPVNFTYIISITNPSGWNIKDESKKEENVFFDYSNSLKITGNTLQATYTYIPKKGVVEPSENKLYKSKMNFINYNLVLSLEETPYKKENTGLNWLLLLTLFTGVFAACILVWYINKQPFKNDFEPRYSSIGGLLVLVGIATLMTPLSLLFAIFQQWESVKTLDYFYYYFNEESDHFSPLKGYYTLSVNFLNVVMMVYSVFLVTIFFQKKASFRPYYSIFKIFNILLLIIDVFIIYQTYSDNSSLEERRILSRQTTALFGLLIGSCIWVPYVWFSERSKHTFTNDTIKEGTNEQEQQF
jgi:hypothetical protein